jgi:bis(5'-nucleosidyl)-tetraphosphatase
MAMATKNKKKIKTERSVGAVVYRIDGRKIFFLLLHYLPAQAGQVGHWGFPKGHIEKGETNEETLRREVKEETGILDLLIHLRFKKNIHYSFIRDKKKIYKQSTFYLAETSTKKIVLSGEHNDYRWLSASGAEECITFENAKRVLTDAAILLAAQ